jgi:hypothetical protein
MTAINTWLKGTAVADPQADTRIEAAVGGGTTAKRF